MSLCGKVRCLSRFPIVVVREKDSGTCGTGANAKNIRQTGHGTTDPAAPYAVGAVERPACASAAARYCGPPRGHLNTTIEPKRLARRSIAVLPL